MHAACIRSRRHLVLTAVMLTVVAVSLLAPGRLRRSSVEYMNRLVDKYQEIKGGSGESKTPAFTDPNPPPPSSSDGQGKPSSSEAAKGTPTGGGQGALKYYRKLRRVADAMYHYKHGSRGRNTWQQGQQGGQGEPYYYPSRGFAEALQVITEAGREVFRRKWGHRDCELIEQTRLKYEDQWRVAQDWE